MVYAFVIKNSLKELHHKASIILFFTYLMAAKEKKIWFFLTETPIKVRGELSEIINQQDLTEYMSVLPHNPMFIESILI